MPRHATSCLHGSRHRFPLRRSRPAWGEEDSMESRYQNAGLFGAPVAENPTGVMVEAAFRQIGLRWRYRPMDIPPADLPAAMAGIRAMSLRGFHCRIAHTAAVAGLLDPLGQLATLMQTVSCVTRQTRATADHAPLSPCCRHSPAPRSQSLLHPPCDRGARARAISRARPPLHEGRSGVAERLFPVPPEIEDDRTPDLKWPVLGP